MVALAARMLVRPGTSIALAGAVALTMRAAHAEDSVEVRVEGSAASGFTSKRSEDDRPRDVPDAAALLQTVPGVSIRRLGAEGTFATFGIRGAASNQVALTLAGVPLSGPADPSFDLATLPLWPGSRAEVHRTFAPAVQGGGYLGGMVAIDAVDSRRTERARTSFYDAIGSFGALRMRVADVRPIDARWTIASGLSAGRADGQFAYFDPVRGADVTRDNAAFYQLAALLHARGDFDHWTTLATFLFGDRKEGVPGAIDAPLANAHMERSRVMVAWEARRRDDAGRTKLRVFARGDERSFCACDPSAAGAFAGLGNAHDRIGAIGAFASRTARIGDDIDLEVALDGGVDGAKSQRTAGDISRERVRGGAAADVNARLSRQARAALSIRLDAVRDGGDEAAGLVALLPAAHLGLEGDLGSHVAIAGHVGTLSRAPSFLELLGDGALFRPSLALTPERAIAADVGARAAFGDRARHLQLETTLFGARTTDAIVFESYGFGTQRAANVGVVLSAGAEVAALAAWGPLRANASYTLLATQDRTSDAASFGKPLPGRPLHNVLFDTAVDIDRFTVRAGIDVLDHTSIDRAATQVLGTRVALSAGLRVRLGVVLLGLDVDNLLDDRTVSLAFASSPPTTARYPLVDAFDYPLPGRRFSLYLRWNVPS